MKTNLPHVAPLLAALLVMTHQAMALESVTVTFQNGLNGYQGTFDRRIGPGGEGDGLAVTGTASFYIDGGATTLNDNGFTEGLVRFGNIETLLPKGAKIVNATLTVIQKTHSNAQSGDSFNVYRLTRPFDSNSGIGSDFGPNGIAGDIDWIAGSFSAVNTQSYGGPVTADVTRVVQSWVDGAPNHGLGIRSDRGTNGWSYHTTGAVQNLRPSLTVTYFVEESTLVSEFQQGVGGYDGGFDIYLNGTGATSTTPGATIVGSTVEEAWLDGLNPPTTEPDISAMMYFGGIETRLAGRKVEAATLRIVTGFSSSAASSGGPFTVHRMLVPFTRESSYADFAGDAGAMHAAGQISPAIASFTNMANCEVVDVDVSAAVRAWLDGEPNHGLYIGSGTNNGWQVFTNGAADPNFRPLLRVVSNPAPIVIAGPANGSRHELGSTLAITATTSVLEPATAAQVEFFIDGLSVGVDPTAPFQLDQPLVGLGTFTLTAEVTDSLGVRERSEPVTITVVPARGSGGLYFDGTTAQVGLGDAPELKLGTFTLETWFKRETPGVAASTGGVRAIPLLAKGRNQADNSTLDTNWFLGIDAATGVLCADFEGAGGANVPVFGTTPVRMGEWMHAAATFDGTEWRLYLNGNLEAVVGARGLLPRADSVQHASIATAMNSNGLGEGAFGGFMDEIRVWSYARSHSQIRQAVHSEIANEVGLIARWGMDEADGTTITSSTTPATTGTFLGNPVRTSGMTYNGNALPLIRFESPVTGTRYPDTPPIELEVSCIDPDGSIQQVEYFDNGVPIGVSTTAPFGITYATPRAGTRRIVAVATDNSGGTSRTDAALTLYTTFASPAFGSQSAAIIHGGDADLATGTPAADPAVWNIVAGSPSPGRIDNPGNTVGDLGLSVEGSPRAAGTGVALTSNLVLQDNLAAIDNIVAPYEAGGVFRISSMDNNGPGEIEPAVSPESSSFALGWFPHAAGWIGANVGADGAIAAGGGLPEHVGITHAATGTYRISGLPTRGNLLAAATGAGCDNVASVSLSGDDWVVTLRDNNQSLENAPFCVLFVPETAERVWSGRIGNLGEVVALNGELERLGATCTLTPLGYEIVLGDGGAIHPANTALFICADADAGNGADNIYSCTANGNAFVVFSHDLPGLSGEMQNGGFRFLAVPFDAPAPVANEVTIQVVDGNAAEDGADQRMAFLVTRSGDTRSDLTVSYTVTGSASGGSDYIRLPGTVVIPAGQASAMIPVTVLADSEMEQPETITLALAPGTGYTPGLLTTASATMDDALSALPTTTVVFQHGLGGYAGQFQKRVGHSLGSGTYTQQLGSSVANYDVDGGDPDINDLIRFDDIIGSGTGRIPRGSTILKAELVLTTATSANAESPGPFVVDRLTSPVDAQTTYAAIDLGAGFEGARGISSGLPVAGFPPLGQGEAGAADVTDIVRAWMAGEPNHGFAVFSGGTADGWNYCTMGNPNVSLRPKLVVTYIRQGTRQYTYAADRSARITSAPGAATADGLTLDAEFIDQAANNSQEALLRFPVVFASETPGAIPLDEDIIKAELLVTTPTAAFSPGAHSAGPVRVHRMLADWNSTSAFGAYGTRQGIHIAAADATMTGLGQGSTTWIDVTSIVRAWRAGSANHGVALKPSTGDDWMLFWPGTTYGASVAPRLRITTAGGSIPTTTPFEDWAAAEGVAGLATDSDDDRDGIPALVEYALGFSAKSPDTLPSIVQRGGMLHLSFPKGAAAAADPRVAYRILGSPDLVTWTAETPTLDDANVIAIEVPATGGRRFYRLEVGYTP